MRVLRTILVLVPMLAFAGWRQVGTVPSLQDLQVVDAGVVLTTSSSAGLALWQVSDAGVNQLATFPGFFVGGGFWGASCFIGLTGTGNLTPSSGACGVAGPLLGSSWSRFRLISAAPWGVAVTTATSSDTMWSGPAVATSWASRGPALSGSGTRTLQTAHISGVDYAVISANNGIRVSVDGGAVPGVAIPSTIWRDAVPFSLAGAPAVLGTTATGLGLLRDYRTPTVFTPSSPAGFSPRFAGMGQLTGMVTTLSGDLLGPIPDPARPAEVWVVRGGPPATLLSERINCLDDRYCVTTTDAGVVWFWENEVAPTIGVVLPQFDAGQTVRLVADAGDGDGDPVFVSWVASSGTITPVAGVQNGSEVDFAVPLNVCTNAPVLDVTVTDGLPSHASTIQVSFPVERAEVVTTASTTRPSAGGAPVTLSAFVDAGCGPSSLTWSTPDGGTGSGATFAWTPPAIECNSDGGLVTITTTLTWPSGMPATTQVTQALVVQPWGAPSAPVFASPGSQPRGVPVDWLSSGAEHACSAANDFPGTTLSWTWTVDGGATVTEVDGGLRIFAAQCVARGDQVIASAVRQVVGDPAQVSAPASLVVEVPPDMSPLDANTDFSISVQGDAGVLFGILKVDAGCLAQRGATVDIRVSSGGIPIVDGGPFPVVDGAWVLPLNGGCSGGTFDVTGELFEGGVSTGATDQGSITLPFTAAQVGTLLVDRIDVTCGAGASGQVRLQPAPNACGVAEVSWRATAGPPLALSAGSGEAFDLQTAALDFSVVGQQVSIEFAADAGAGNVDVATRTVELGVQPFLVVGVQPHPALRREEETVTLEVTLSNPTACAVEGLSLTLPLSGATALPQSVLLDGRRVAATATDDGVLIEGLSVPASGQAKLELSARPRLLSAPKVVPVASLNGYVVSIPEVEAPRGTGCGCDVTPGLWGVLALLVLRRRRRAPR